MKKLFFSLIALTLTVGLSAQVLPGPGFLRKPNTAFNPLTLSPSVWLDASDAATVNATTRVWSDKSGSNRNATSAAGEFPSVVGNLLRFNGSHFMSGNYPSGTTNATWFIFFNPNGDAGYYLFGTNNLANYGWDRWNSDGKSYPDRFRNPRLETYGLVDLPTTGNTIISGIASAATWEQWINGTTQGAATPSFQSGTTYAIGNNLGRINGTQYAGDIGEIIVYPSVLTTTQRQQTEGYLAWKWGTVASLPAGHPYKNAAP